MTRRAIAVAWAEASAKVNLALAVGGRRPDGYHELRSVFLRLALHDHLEVRLAAEPRADDRLRVAGPTDLMARDNLVLRAVARLREVAGRPLPALAFRLDKHIPVAAGLGGGSSDAAAALELAARAWDLPLDRAALSRVGFEVGADVPFFAAGGSAALVSGAGEVVETLPEPHPPAGLLLVTTSERLSTAAVFAELDRLSPPGPGPGETARRVETLARALAAGMDGAGLTSLAADLRDANDLWPPAVRLLPGLRSLREALEDRLGRALLLSGSGPTLVAVYPSREAAQAAAAVAQAALPALGDATITVTSSHTRGGSS